MKKTIENGYIQHVRKNADAGQAWAEKSMGDAFYFGVDMDANHKKAFEWYQKAAKQGDSAAMHAVGRAYYFGEGIKENDKKAAEWYRKAADVGDAKSLYSLARMYHRGLGIKPDLIKAENFYLKAIGEHANKDSLYPLARLYLENPEFKKDPRDIIRLLLLASKRGENKAAEYDIDFFSHLWDDISPSRYKEIIRAIHEDLERDWNPETITKAAVSGIREKVAIAGIPSKLLSAEEVFDRVWQSIVYIKTEDSSGSGVIVQPDVVATNFHVVKGADEISVYQSEEKSGRENTPHPASLPPVRVDGRDYCLLHVPSLPGSGIPAIIRHYDTLKIGETVYALGAPKGEILSFSKGIISQLRPEAEYVYSDSEGNEKDAYAPAPAIQSDANIAQGSSGGGLFDSAGNLIGHPTFGLEGLEFSIPADIVLEFE